MLVFVESGKEMPAMQSEWIKEPGVEDPPLRSHIAKQTLKGEIQQGWGYVLFVWNLSKRIRSWKNRIRFIVGLILWKPILPEDE
jgi:hypothetical protein